MANTRQRVSPHFVFNVLNSRMMHTDQQEADQLMKLTKLIRANLDLTRKNIVTLSEELDFVSQYVEIEKQFIGEDFEFSIQAPDREPLEEIRIPSMMVQILTENAILHGLKNKDGKKRLWIQITKDSEQTRISVNDNGPGFDILRYNSKRTRTGLNIIRTTISIINQENYANKMSFDIRNDNGCHAILTIPHDIHFTHL
jgi:LytS/YehU family sensor histidine kinase